MKTYIIISLKLTALTMILFGIIYPGMITGLALLTGPDGGTGEHVRVAGRVVGFDRIGQSFVSPKYFHGRPSAVGYNAASTGGSNKGPTNPDYLAEVEQRINVLLEENPSIRREDIPVDLVTASGGGLDPHISPAAAKLQVSRIARERGMSEEYVRSLIDKHTEGPLWGLLGTSTVNVLRINLALDEQK